MGVSSDSNALGMIPSAASHFRLTARGDNRDRIGKKRAAAAATRPFVIIISKELRSVTELTQETARKAYLYPSSSRGLGNRGREPRPWSDSMITIIQQGQRWGP